jgi:hypothetical protein
VLDVFRGKVIIHMIMLSSSQMITRNVKDNVTYHPTSNVTNKFVIQPDSDIDVIIKPDNNILSYHPDKENNIYSNSITRLCDNIDIIIWQGDNTEISSCLDGNIEINFSVIICK